MLTMDHYDYIRKAHRVYGKSIRRISRETGHSRNTVKKALRMESWGYTARTRQPYPVLGPYLGIMDRWLEEDTERPPNSVIRRFAFIIDYRLSTGIRERRAPFAVT